jgi:hypothetical protein
MGHEAIPVGRRWMSKDTLFTLCAWADRIVVMQPHMADSIPGPMREKVRVLDVGEDTYGLHIPDALMQKVMAGVKGVL